MINWRDILKDGLPTDDKVGYLVSDGESIEYSDFEIKYIIDGTWDKDRGEFNKVPNGGIWIGGSVYAIYEEASHTNFDFHVKYYCPVSELNLPNHKIKE